jgi:hypothetical protein
MSTANAFTPNTAGTVTVAVSGSSVATALTKGSIAQQVMVQSLAASAIAFIEFGTSAATSAIASGTPILPGQSYTFTVGPTTTHVAVIGTAGTLYLTCGQGGVPT